ncbi:MAG: GHKL domain-containing protein [candidate division Zixibacteria bacterium]|nr:GHKL domain-containing protein [candidate division Zixibacteria bacterium]
MLFRTKIFRHLVLFSIIPSLILAVSAYFLLNLAVEQTGTWLSGSAPDRTINAMRFSEDRLQEIARKIVLSESHTTDTLLDWCTNGGKFFCEESYGKIADSIHNIIRAAAQSSGPIREFYREIIIIGYAYSKDDSLIAGGFILDEQYVTGLNAATVSLRESRQYTNIMPGFILFLITGVGVILVLVITIAYWLSRRLSASITIPLEQLMVASKEMGRGETVSLIQLTGTEEVRNLALSFTKMSEELEVNRKKLMAAERVSAWQEFARRMAHELKNPLTPISLSLYRIKKRLEKSGDFGPYQDSVEAIAAELAHLERMANEYSSLAKLPESHLQKMNFGKLLLEIINLHQVQLEAFDFRHNLDSKEMIIDGDRDRLREVMVNILKNALEFCIVGGTIELTTHLDNGLLVVVLWNETEHVSDKALQSAKLPGFTTRKGGSGLGLAISEKIIIDHGGTLQISGTEGSTIVKIELPKDVR